MLIIADFVANVVIYNVGRKIFHYQAQLSIVFSSAPYRRDK